MKLFDEKYGDKVRVVRVLGVDGKPVSTEFCGGIHCKNTGEIEAFAIESEKSISLIEKAIDSIDNVVRSCTIFDEEKSKLYSFYIGDIDKAELKTKLREILPVYMQPTSLIKIEEFPLNKNGKIDRKKLMEEKKCLKV